MEDKKNRKIQKWPIITILLLLALFYIDVIWLMNGRFLFHTTIGDYDVSLQTLEETEKMIKDDILSDYRLSIKTIDDKIESIEGSAIDLDLDLNLTELKDKQNIGLWPITLFSESNYPLDYSVKYDEEKLMKGIESLDSFQDENMTEPKNAYVSDYITGEGYKIIKEDNGNTVIKDKVIESVRESVLKLEKELDIQKEGYYETAKIKEDSSDLIAKLNEKNKSVSASITYEIGENIICLDADTYHEWLQLEDGNMTVNDEAVSAFVDELAKQTNTSYTTRDFVTSTGETVKVTGPYGYQIEKDKEKEQIIVDILSGEAVKREPIYSLVGAGRSGNDYGTTYIEVDLTNQKVYLYVDGALVKSSDCVTGCVANGNATPPGIFPMTYKQKDAVLRGPGYASPVKYWMPFNRGIGLHDASWRGSFGGTIYKTSGSHGCINLPTEMAKVVYENAYQGMPVICHD